LGLALDVLAEVGEEQHAPHQFWKAMHRAAKEMELSAEDSTHGRSVKSIERHLATPERRFPCPCCGHVVFPEPPGSYAICPLCRWEDDIVQLRWPDSAGGANRASLIESQRYLHEFGAKEGRFPSVRRAVDDEGVEDGWRPIDEALDSFEPQGVQEASWPVDVTVLYWWRSSFWRRSAPPT
jgi:hypothetical protein